MEQKQKIVVLWLLTVCGFICHSVMDLLPLFWSENVAVSYSGEAPAGMLVMMAAFSLLVPACGIFCLLFGKEQKWTLWVNAVLASLIGLFNIVHAGMELPGNNAAQYVVMPIMIVIGVVMAWLSVQLLRKSK